MEHLTFFRYLGTFFYFKPLVPIFYCSPKNTPQANITRNGLRRPNGMVHLSLNDPSMGVTKNPIQGDTAHTSVIC